MTRKGVTLFSITSAIILGLLPVILAIAYAYIHTINLAKSNLEDIARSIAKRNDIVFQTIRDRLDKMGHVDAGCEKEDILSLRKLVFNLPVTSEVGLIDKNGYILCSSMGKLKQPIKVPEFNDENDYHLLGPILLKKINEKVLIAGITRSDGTSINAFMIPKSLINDIDNEDIGKKGFVAIVRPHDKHIYAEIGNIPNIDITVTEKQIRDGIMGYQMVFKDGIERFVIAVKLKELDHVWAVSAASKAWVLSGWINMALILSFFGLIISTALVSLVVFLMRRRLSLESELSRAIQKNELIVHYQPVIDLASKKCIGAEALVRWKHPEEGLIAPDLFIPLAETTGLIEPMTEWVMKRVRDDLQTWLSENPHMHVAINLSPKHFESDRILIASENIFSNSTIKPNQLIYEITERGLISDDIGLARHIMHSLRHRGSTVALDDFGTGYSSLSYLGTFPLDYLKIDKQFIDAIGKEAVTTHLVDAIIEMAKRLNLKLIAEGVETEHQADYLVEHGVDYAQGWLYSKALSKHDFFAWLSDDK